MKKIMLPTAIFILFLGQTDTLAQNKTQYEFNDGTWQTKQPMPLGRTALTSSVIDGKIYVIGRKEHFQHSILSSIEKYDPEQFTWEGMILCQLQDAS